MAERARRWPEKHNARNAVHYALRKGKIQRQPCEQCGSTHRVEAHHGDYSRPLDIRWLCATCHRIAHSQAA